MRAAGRKMKIGIGELAIVFFVALFVIGPDKLPEAARKFGEILGQFKKASDEATREIRKSVIDPLEEAQKPIREAMAPVQEISDQVEQNRKSIEKAFRNIGKADKKTDPQTDGPSGGAEPDTKNDGTVLQADDIRESSDQSHEQGIEHAQDDLWDSIHEDNTPDAARTEQDTAD